MILKLRQSYPVNENRAQSVPNVSQICATSVPKLMKNCIFSQLPNLILTRYLLYGEHIATGGPRHYIKNIEKYQYKKYTSSKQ